MKNSIELVYAKKNGVTGQFSKKSWDSLPAGKYGWSVVNSSPEDMVKNNLKVLEFINESSSGTMKPQILSDKLPEIIEQSVKIEPKKKLIAEVAEEEKKDDTKQESPDVVVKRKRKKNVNKE